MKSSEVAALFTLSFQDKLAKLRQNKQQVYE